MINKTRKRREEKGGERKGKRYESEEAIARKKK